MIEKELKTKGSRIPVTEANKKEYVELMLQWRLAHGVQEQMENLVKGLKEMIPLEYLQPFDAKELEWVIAGTPEINMEDWKKNTIYYGGVCVCVCERQWLFLFRLFRVGHSYTMVLGGIGVIY